MDGRGDHPQRWLIRGKLRLLGNRLFLEEPPPELAAAFPDLGAV